MANDVAVPEYLKKYMAANSASSDVDSMAASSISVPRISLKGKKFQFINGDEESRKTDEIFIVILAVEPEGSRMVKTFYAKGYDPNNTAPPDCSSSDGLAPDSWVTSPVSATCNGCPKNAFGSALSPSGKKTKACRDAKRLWVTQVEAIDGVVYGLNVPVTSLKLMAEYGKQIRGMGIPLAAVITKITMDDDSEFPMIHFDMAGFLNEEVGQIALERNTSKDWLVSRPSGPALAAPQRQAALPSQSNSPAQHPTDSGKTVDPEAVDKIAENW